MKLDHINLTVTNLEASIDWYGRVFGMELVEEGRDERPWAIVACNDSMICMTEYSGLDAPDRSGSRHRVNHFGIRIADEDDWRATVDREQLPLYYGGVNEYPHSRSWYIKDPSGHTIEVSYSETAALRFPG